MKITKQQLVRIINELHPRDVADAEYDLLQDLGGMYSDMHKELYGRRPKIPMFKTVEEAETAVDEIWAEYAAVNRAREEQEQQDLEYMEMERLMQELMPGEYDIELPMHSGMGRRTESIMRITKNQLRRIIREEKARLQEAGPNYPKHMFPERTPAKQGTAMTTTGDPQSYGDLASRLNNLTRLLEDLSMDYVDSGWLKDGDHASLAADLDNLFQDSDRLSMALFGLAKAQGELVLKSLNDNFEKSLKKL